MDIENLRDTWEAFAESNPMWSILTKGESIDYQWDENEFFESGKNAINRFLNQMNHAQLDPLRSKALDFGCGIGRLTLNLADIFTEVHGIDISKSMIEKAEFYCKKRNKENCFFHVNTKGDLSVYEDDTFDFIVSMITLQHMKQEYSTAYLLEFIRILKPGGLLFFQLPNEITNLASYNKFEQGMTPEMEMYGIKRTELIELIESMHAKVKVCIEDSACGSIIRSFRYIVEKNLK